MSMSSTTVPSTPVSDAPPAAAAPSAVSAVPSRRAAQSTPRRPLIILGVISAVVLTTMAGYAFATRNEESTDDAQVDADIVAIAPRVAGVVRSVAVHDNQIVKAGDLLFELDDADYAAKVAQARAELETAQAQSRAADAQVQVVDASAKGGFAVARAAVSGSAEQVQSASAQIGASQAALKRAQTEEQRVTLDYDRVNELVSRGAAPQQQLDDVRASRAAAHAGVELAQAELDAAEQGARAARSRVAEAQGRLSQNAPIDSQIDVARANAELARARVSSAQAALSLAELQLSYTKVRAPSDGMVSKLSARPGQLVAAGQGAAELVPTLTYVVANFKETQVGRVRPNQRVEIHLDAYPHRTFEGRVESVSGGTGARFALLPPDNASGNFVKVVQRVPVRVSWVGVPAVPLRAGLSADVVAHVE